MTTTLDYWTGAAGDAYTERNPVTAEAIQARALLWKRILHEAAPDGALPYPMRVLEVGANIGLHLRAVRDVVPKADLQAVEPNAHARWRLGDEVLAENRIHETIATAPGGFDLVFTAGVLIHVPPDDLMGFCNAIYERSKRWIVSIEYFSKEPREVEYRGERGRLWTRDFGKLYLQHFPDLRPLAAGFAWEPLTGLDDVTWIVLEKRP